ncbi:MAG TPA: hypothetical protein VIQ51_11435, partial [Chryseosolibacter sp.]
MKRPSLRSLLLILPCITAFHLDAIAIHDSTAVGSAVIRRTLEEEVFFRDFETLSLPISHPTNTDPIVADDGLISDTILDKRSHAHALLQKVLSAQRTLESLD